MSQQITTTTSGIRVEDITFKRARKQSEILAEMGVPEEQEEKVEAPTSLTPEQIKDFYMRAIASTQDQSLRRVYAQTIRWIDELASVKKELGKYMMKELIESGRKDNTPDDIV